MKTRDLTRAAVLSAFSLAVLFGAASAPTAQLALVAVASLPAAVLVLRGGFAVAAAHYAVVAALGLLLLPDKTCALWYALVLGHYAIVKALIERLRRAPVEWILKLIVFAAVIGALYAVSSRAFFAPLPEKQTILLFAALLICFVLYDVGLSRLIAFYRARIDRYLK